VGPEGHFSEWIAVPILVTFD